MRLTIQLDLFRDAWGLIAGQAYHKRDIRKVMDEKDGKVIDQWSDIDRKEIGNYILLDATGPTPRLFTPARGVLVSVDLPLGVEVREPGRCLLLPADVARLLKVSRAAEITLEATAPGSIEVSLPRGRATWRTPDPDTYFPLPNLGPLPGTWALPARDFARMVGLVLDCVDPRSERYALSGVNLEYAAGRLHAVATDGVRLAWAHAAASSEGNPYAPTTNAPSVPAKALARAIALCLHAPDAPARVGFHPGGFRLEVEDSGTLLSPLVAGRFPAWRGYLPPERPTARLHFDRAGDLLRLMEQAAIMTAPEHKGVEIRSEPGTLRARAEAPDVGSCRLSLPGLATSGVSGALILDAGLVLAPLRKLVEAGDEPIDLDLNTERLPIAVRARDYVYSLVPFQDLAPAAPARAAAVA